jgi:hypothetical protein
MIIFRKYAYYIKDKPKKITQKGVLKIEDVDYEIKVDISSLFQSLLQTN